MFNCHFLFGWCSNITSSYVINSCHPVLCRCAVDRLQTDNGSLVILCTDASGRNTTAGRILEITKGRDFGELKFP